MKYLFAFLIFLVPFGYNMYTHKQKILVYKRIATESPIIPIHIITVSRKIFLEDNFLKITYH